ncbi:glucoamylase [Mumia zhuanghuii]|uniref:Glycoside hydrolase family 15 protein n=2 Tax=Mumia TaxID=1546255 RepID=A0ABW1QL41_9ACTN|nr:MULTISPECIES: glycoside hydrolase family 15 protein [Mumia]KAA1418206.1 glucoamylase [Mumia zhuanghuii]
MSARRPSARRPSSRRIAAATAVAVSAVLGASLLAAVPAAGAPRAPAPDGPGLKSTWTEADKTGFGTARSRRSNVWFTLQRGRVSEVFYPDLSTPSVRSLELVVTDGATFTDRESVQMRPSTTRPDARSLRFKQIGGRAGRYRVTKRVVTDPRRDALVLRVRLRSLDGRRYQLYVRHDPALTNNGMDDRAWTAGRTLVASDGAVATAVRARPRFGARSNGYVGRASDGWRDLRRDHDLDRRHRSAGPGNVVQTARVSRVNGLPGRQRATVTLGFGRRPAAARATARASARSRWSRIERRYDRGWHRYLASLKPVPRTAKSVKREYLASALVLAAAEDKLNPGAVVASPSAPWVWGDEVPDLSSPSGAYHLVWSRDSYEFGSAMWAMGDRAAARRIVDWLFQVQQKPDGSFPQNSDVTGEPVWSELQLDEVALPIVLASLTGKTGPATYAGVKRAADFLVRFRDEETGLAAPFSPQERWENQAGYSPNSIAAQIAGLVCAADIARRNGDQASARRWLELADSWAAQVKGWTVTTTGPLSTQPYFLRLTKNGQPDTASPYDMGDGGPLQVDQRRVVDPSFLALTRWGILPATDPAVASSLAVVDDELRVQTPNGPFWRRFSFDGYGETRDGTQWTITEPGTFTTLGRGWPILTGERGEQEVAAGRDASSYLAAVAAAGNGGDMISEQVWDGRPPTGQPCCTAGEGTRAATPLVWSHGVLVRLAWSMQLGRPADQQAVVARRYLP